MGVFGVVVLVTVPVLYSQGFYVPFGPEVTALKTVSSVVRAILLIACAILAWRFSPRAVWLAWLAFAAFVVGGAADQVFKRGVVDGFQSLISAYYLTSAGHVLVAVALWLLLLKRGNDSVRE